MKFKNGVKLHNMQPQILLALQIAEQVYNKYAVWKHNYMLPDPEGKREMVVNSVDDDRHSENSKHYMG